jgi:hypothetical protein
MNCRKKISSGIYFSYICSKLFIMKKLILFFILAITAEITSAQVPEAFRYQAVVRDGGGTPVADQVVSMQILIINGALPGTVVYAETHSTATNSFGMVNLIIGGGTVDVGSFSAIDWASGPFFVKVKADITGGTNYVDMGDAELLSVPFALYAKQAGSQSGGHWNANGNDIYNTNSGKVGVGIQSPPAKLVVQGDSSMADTVPLFEVKDKSGNTVFIVYPDSARFYLGDDGSKTNKGAFAVSGRNTAKQPTNNFLWVTPDSVRVFLDSSSTKGGFAVQSFGSGNNRDYMSVYVDTAEVINPSVSRMLWYPSKEAFLSGRVLIQSPDSVGTNSWATGYEAKAVGSWSQSLGYKTVARGDYSTAIGRNSVAHGESSFAFGNGAFANAVESYAFGSGAIASGIGSYAIGSQGIDTATGLPNMIYTRASGMYSFAIGQGSQSNNLGSMCLGLSNVSTGMYSLSMGTYSIASGAYSTAIGAGAQAGGFYSTSLGTGTNASAELAVSIGQYATSSATNAVAIGYMAEASGPSSYSFGYFTHATAINSFAAGLQSNASGVGAVSIGYNSSASGSSSAAFGSGIATGQGSMSVSIASESIGEYSSAFGYDCKTFGRYSSASGMFSVAMGDYSISIGQADSSIGNNSMAMGLMTKAMGAVSTSMGFSTVAAGDYSTATGLYTKAKPYASFVIGRYNDTLCYGTGYWESLDPLFVVGNGLSDASRSNAMWVRKDGEIYFPFAYDDQVDVTNRDLYIDNTGKIGYLSSSAKYKDFIRDMGKVDWLYELRPVNYIYKKDKNRSTEFGLIAEEVETVNPDFVSHNADGSPETVQYSKLITPMLKAIQEQKDMLDQQQVMIEKLQQENHAMRRELEKLSKD